VKPPLRPDIPPEVVAVLRTLPPDLKRAMKSAIRLLCRHPDAGDPLRRELEGLWRYRVRRYRIVYGLERSARVLRVFAVGHRTSVYETLGKSMRRLP
jgi:mRNA interferase RelE/StbE